MSNVYMLTTFQLDNPSYGNQFISNFRVLTQRDRAMIAFSKNYILVCFFLAICEVKIGGKVFIEMYVCAVQVISGQDNQTKYWCATKLHQYGGSILASVNLCEILRQITWRRVFCFICNKVLT